MKIAALPGDEEFRLFDLYSYDILDSAPEREYDELVQLASQVCKCPISLITFVDADRQWFKAKIGVQESETPRNVAFCAHTMLSDKTMIIEDALLDERFVDNPLVTGGPGIRFYAGAPILSPNGHRLGSICVIDNKPGTITEAQQNALTIISRQITKLMELRTINKLVRQRATDIIEMKDNTLEEVIRQHDESDKDVANELHEEIAQKVAACKMRLHLAGNNEDLKANVVPWVTATMTDIINEIRNLSNSIMPTTLGSAPLQILLNDLVQRMKTIYPFKVTVSFTGHAGKLKMKDSIDSFRIVEKWLGVLAQRKNIRNVRVAFDVKERIELTITDDGLLPDFSEMEKNIIMSMVYTRVRIAKGSVAYNTLREKKNVLLVQIPGLTGKSHQ